MHKEITRQNEINDGLTAGLKNAATADPMKLAARVQKAMMENPQEAMKLMQAE